ncbi:MAG: aldo/keto reductase [Candidatus Azotimanducaceae bacterium WSBS_2022_MAG_OTU7]
MNRNRLGRSGIVVSDICMGTMTFGTGADEKTAFEIMDKAFDAGIDFFDTAEMYPVPPDPSYVGRTEEIVGRWRRNRDAIILATKVAGPSHGWIRAAVREGMTVLDRHNIVRAFEGSLKSYRLTTLTYTQTHWPDHDMPYDEILAALDDLIQAGKVRIIGCSNETTWGLTKSLGVSELHGLARYPRPFKTTTV